MIEAQTKPSLSKSNKHEIKLRHHWKRMMGCEHIRNLRRIPNVNVVAIADPSENQGNKPKSYAAVRLIRNFMRIIKHFCQKQMLMS